MSEQRPSRRPLAARRAALLAALTVVMALATSRWAGAAPELRTLFPWQAELFADPSATSDRLARLELPPEVVSVCRGDLADLRVFDRDGREVPFLVDSALPPATRREVRQSFVPELLEVQQEVTERAAGQPALRRESYLLTAPREPSQTGSWDLVAAAGARRFVHRVTVEALAADGAPVTLIADGSLFRLESPPREKVRLILPAFSARHLRVTLEGEDDSFLEPVFRFESSRSLPGQGRAVVELAELSRQQTGGKTLLELARPRGLRPDVLRLTTSTSSFNRPVEVWDEGPGARDDAAGQQTLFRVRALTTVEELELPLGPVGGDRLRVVITDGDSPPLADLQVHAVVRRPALLFSLPGAAAAAGEPAGVLRFGGGRAYHPEYDLANLLPSTSQPLAGTAAAVAERLADPALLGEVRLGAIGPNPYFDPAPALAFAHRPGSAIEPGLYRFRRELAVTPSPEGLARLRLAAEDLAQARPDLADLRIVDGDFHQWAYLLEPDTAVEEHALSAPAPLVRAGTSVYDFPLPASALTLDALVLETSAPFFDRAFTLVGERDAGEVTLAEGRLVRRIGDPRPVEVRCAAARIEALELRITDGDDAPLVLDRVTFRLSVPELYFAAPAGRYALLLGNPEDRAPRYELTRVRDVVLAVASADVDAAALAENPDYSSGARFATDQGAQQLLLWLALAAAVVVLSVLTLKLARRHEG